VRRATPGEVLGSLAFYGAFYLGTIFYVLAALAVLGFSRNMFERVINAWSAFHRVCARWLLGIRVCTEGAPPPGPALIAIKHESFFEAIDLTQLLRRPAVFAKAELLDIPLWGRTGRAYGLIPVDRAAGASTLRAMRKAASEYAGQGRPLAIFPEGKRVPHGTRPALQSGFAGIYKLVGLPVIPVAVNSGPLYHRRWKRSGTITYRFAEPIPPGLKRDELEARVHAAINALAEGPD
jgi:1-acyl-sn-glycerol-3-phosphate acyltransferase